jgi:UDP-N-acetylmuramoyl-L-alanyl-D-glutamate--2,6-diaminopimelate ligase
MEDAGEQGRAVKVRMRLDHLIEGIPSIHCRGDTETLIQGIAYDSRAVKPGYLFVALKGHSKDGHRFIREAIQNGAGAVVLEPTGLDREIDSKVPLLSVLDSRDALSTLAVNYYGRPFQDMNLIGITGTNGKTTVSYMLEAILSAGGGKPGVIGTINYRFAGQELEAPVTTPESLDLMRILREMSDHGVTDVVMEVSSHALAQGRTKHCPFRVAIFTNLSRDHLDYHLSMEDYFEAKSRLFLGLKERRPHGSSAIINLDDLKGKALADLTDASVVTYGLGRGCDVKAVDVQATRTGLAAKLITPGGELDIRSSLMGRFNIYNVLAASAAAFCMDIDLEAIAAGVESLKGVPGRLELVENTRSLTILVDYAHTPGALMLALQAVRGLGNGRLITVFGCGGNRDKGKREEMGRVAGRLSDLVFITSDNPRHEEPEAIASQVEKGVRETGMNELTESPIRGLPSRGYIVDLDRASAIWRAIAVANDRDLILIAGKGHEAYQIIRKRRRDFDDRKVAATAAASVGKKDRTEGEP